MADDEAPPPARAEVFRRRLAVGVFFFVIAAVFVTSVGIEMTRGGAEGGGGLVIPPPPPPPPPGPEALRERLASPDPVERVRAMRVLRAQGDKDVVGWILRALGDPHPLVRQAAVGEVRSMGPAYLAYVAPLLADPDKTVRDAAIGAFGEAPAFAAPYVVSYLAHPDTAVARAAWRLFEPIWRKDPAAGRSVLAAGLAARDEEVRAQAAAFARALPPDDRRPFEAYLERIAPETPAAAAASAGS